MNDMFGRSRKPVYQGYSVYRDVADNLSKIDFPVIVTEGYNPNVHWSYLREGAPPPIFDPGPNMIAAECEARLSGDFIIDALVNGQYLRFKNPDDMEVLAEWIEQYMNSYKGIDLSMHPDRKAFLENCRLALGMLRGNISRKEAYERETNPKQLTLAELIAYM